MNIHVSPTTFHEHPELDFRGKPWFAGGYRWHRAKYKIFYLTLYYCYELNCAVDKTMYDHIVKYGTFS
jgi:hypothetical protein